MSCGTAGAFLRPPALRSRDGEGLRVGRPGSAVSSCRSSLALQASSLASVNQRGFLPLTGRCPCGGWKALLTDASLSNVVKPNTDKDLWVQQLREPLHICFEEFGPISMARPHAVLQCI